MRPGGKMGGKYGMGEEGEEGKIDGEVSTKLRNANISGETYPIWMSSGCFTNICFCICLPFSLSFSRLFPRLSHGQVFAGHKVLVKM
jgi:hypothetical protein